MSNCKTQYRIVMDCYVYRQSDPFADAVNELFPTKDAADTAVRACVKDELESLSSQPIPDIEDCDHLPFRADFDGDDTASVRFWDGDDWWYVTVYNIHAMTAIPEEKLPTWEYRGYRIVNDKPYCYRIYKDGQPVNYLADVIHKVLLHIDALLLQQSIGEV